MVDSCRDCSSCKAGDEQYCATGAVMTYNGKSKYKHCEEYNEESSPVFVSFVLFFRFRSRAE